MRDLFASNPQRFEQNSLQLGPLLVDYSKNRITEQTLPLLCQLATEARLPEAIAAMFRGDIINITERRPALHVALRHPIDNIINNRNNRAYTSTRRFLVDEHNVIPDIQASLNALQQWVTRIHNGTLRGATGKRITDVINLGIGGSELGPAMVVDACDPYRQAPVQTHFVANVDGISIDTTLQKLNPETTLLFIASKSFTTKETCLNAKTACAWLTKHLRNTNTTSSVLSAHVAAATAHPERARAWGVSNDRIFAFWPWVGGRFSLWSTAGGAIPLALGTQSFEQLLQGAHAMDAHFEHTPLMQNIPVVMALLSLWYINFWDATTHAIMPYDQRLQRLPAYIQQLEMESNGKHTCRDGTPINDYKTAPVIWGQPGTHGQHAFFQHLHQGTEFVPIDFIAAAKPAHALYAHHTELLANCLAQSQALMQGDLNAADPHRLFRGNRPSNTLLLEELTPYSLGMLLALYEHQTYVKSVLWDINGFDQHGVELGKQLAKHLGNALAHDHVKHHEHRRQDPSTQGLLTYLKKHR